MAINLLSHHEEEEEDEDDDYIDMEIGSPSNFLCQSIPSPHQNPREFEFQMSSTPLETEPTTSPADELFYKGKLLPLHLPPRLQMVETIVNFSNSIARTTRGSEYSEEEFFSTPLVTNTTPTPFESCSVSPSESCRVSRELNPNEHLWDFSTEVRDSDFNIIGEQNSKKSWTRKIKLIKQSSIGSKLKASRAYLKSLFGKSDHVKNASEESELKAKQLFGKHEKVVKNKHHKESISCETEKKLVDNSSSCHRRSFSVSIKRHSSNKIPSTSSSNSSSGYLSLSSCSKNPNGFSDLQLLKRSSSVNSGVESPIQGAIAHCKKSQHAFPSRRTLCEAGFYSISAGRISVSEDQEKLLGLCRG